MLAGDIPEGDVDRAQRAHDGRAAEVGPAVEVLPVVLDPQRVLADQVALEGLHGLGEASRKPHAPDSPRPTSPASVWTCTNR